MFRVLIKDFEFNTEHVFAKAVPFEEFGFNGFCEAMLKAFGPALKAADISLDQGDRLYNYRLTFRMFNGSAEVILTSAGATAVFRNGRNKVALQTVATCVVALEMLLDRFTVQVRQAVLGVHATFEKEEEYASHMATVIPAKKGYSAAGVTLHCSANIFDGQLRLATDKSLAYDHGIFTTYQVMTAEKFSQELLGKLETRFEEIAQDVQLKFILTE